MRRLFVEESIDLEKNDAAIEITGSDANHLLYAMRVRPGQQFTIVDKNGLVVLAEVVCCTSDTVSLKCCGAVDDGDTEPPISAIIAQCLPKGDKMDYIVQKAVELGADEIVPTVSRHCVVKYDEKKKKARQAKWQKISDEAAKQCGRTALPSVAAVTELSELMQLYSDYVKLACYESEAQQGLKDALQKCSGDKYLLLIGPEGGFAPEEIALCKEHGFISISLGRRILRTETASLASLAVLMYEKGDLS